MGTKNNPKNRGGVAKKTVNGKEVKPVYYMGKRAGHGNYIAGQFDSGDMICSNEGVPTPFNDITFDAVAS